MPHRWPRKAGCSHAGILDVKRKPGMSHLGLPKMIVFAFIALLMCTSKIITSHLHRCSSLQVPPLMKSVVPDANGIPSGTGLTSSLALGLGTSWKVLAILLRNLASTLPRGAATGEVNNFTGALQERVNASEAVDWALRQMRSHAPETLKMLDHSGRLGAKKTPRT